MKKSGLLALAAVLIVLFMFPCAGLSETPKYGGTLVVGTEADLVQLDPHKCAAALDGAVFQLVCNSLIEPGYDFENKPGLAESWDVSADGKEWTFYLRKGVKFHNGREMTAEDVKFSHERIMDPQVASTIASRFINLDRIEVVDKYTVKFIMKKPAGATLASIGGSAVRAAIIAPECVNEDGTISHPIGTGAFEWVEWKPKDYWKVKRFNDYWNKGKPYLDEIIFKPLPDEMMRFNALKAGDLDIALVLPIDEAAKALKNPERAKGVEFSMHPLGGANFIMFNCGQPPYDDVRVRQAFAYSIQRDEILLGVSQGYGHAINQLFAPTSFWYVDVPTIPRDIEKAKALLAEAGFPDGLDVTMTITNAYPEFPRFAQVAQQQLKEAGINVTLDVSDWASWISKVVN
ncbi:MAG: ABC transporter substrate-binding protein, partial [Deltaproteobacteria bacterium]|nr:ABC transporter substrate-binding protein [Deltaproteobacteria bacterium]